MDPVAFKGGTVILREKTYDPSAYLILSGLVEVSREKDGRREVLAQLGPGEIFGEMGLILDRPRTASVAALDDTVCERVDPENFGRILSSEPEKIVPFIRMLFERYRVADAHQNRSAGFVLRSARPQCQLKTPSLKPLTRRAADALGGKPLVTIESFPFRIGRKTGALFSDVTSMNDLLLLDQQPFHVSRNHCSVNRLPDDGGFFVVDRGSSLGTIVNGVPIGIAGEENEAPLDRASNEIVLGSAASPLRFEVAVQ